MKFNFKKETNINFEKNYYGIVQEGFSSTAGIFRMKVEDIDWNSDLVIFDCPQQRFKYMACRFIDMDKYVFETEEEAKEAYKSLTTKDGMWRADNY